MGHYSGLSVQKMCVKNPICRAATHTAEGSVYIFSRRRGISQTGFKNVAFTSALEGNTVEDDGLRCGGGDGGVWLTVDMKHCVRGGGGW